MLLFGAPLILTLFWPASTLLCSCHSVSSRDRSSNFGALGLRWWGSAGQINPSEGFWSRILVWRAIAFVNVTHWIGFCMSELFRKIGDNFGGFKTQPNCRVFDDLHPQVRDSTHDGCHALQPHSIVTFVTVLSCRSYFFNMATALLSSFFLDLSVGCSSTWRCAYEHFFPNLQPLLDL